MMLLLSIGLVIGMLSSAACASDWASFQENNYNNGVVSEELTTDFSGTTWSAYVTPGAWAGWDSAPVIGDGIVYNVFYNGKVYAFDLDSGAEVWNNTQIGTAGYFEMCVPAYVADKNILYVGLSAGNQTLSTGIHALNATTGALIWSNGSSTYFPASHQLNSGIKYDAETDAIYFGSYGSNGRFYSVDADTGEVNWMFTGASAGYYWATPAIIGDYVVVGNESGYVTSFDKTDGSVVATYNTGTNVPIRSGITYDSATEKIFFTVRTTGTGAGKLVSLDFGSGQFSNESSVTGVGSALTTTPTVVGDYVFVSGGTYLRAYYKDLTTDITPRNVNGGIKASPVISTYNGIYHIYVTTNTASGKCYYVSFNPSTNQFSTPVAWNVSNPGYTLQGVAAADGWIVYGNDAGYMYGVYKN